VHETSMRTFVIFVSIMWLIGCVLAVLILRNSFEAHSKKAEAAAYQQGRKDALYKRPASDDLELVCAGLWLSQLKPGEQ